VDWLLQLVHVTHPDLVKHDLTPAYTALRDVVLEHVELRNVH
jgi:hypothetical protein